MLAVQSYPLLLTRFYILMMFDDMIVIWSCCGYLWLWDWIILESDLMYLNDTLAYNEWICLHMPFFVELNAIGGDCMIWYVRAGLDLKIIIRYQLWTIA